MFGASLGALYVKLAMQGKDEFDHDIDDAGSKAETLGDKLKKGAKVVGAATLSAVTAGAAAVTGLTKSAVSQYGRYEQLAGGAKLMFGDAYDYVAEKAAGAASKIGVSQNEYLSQVNGLATGLKTALKDDAQAAAELANKVVTAEADVVAATGASQEAVQNAFNGIMKGNYTMLDNLQLGITPTKNGMKEVIKQVNQWNKDHGKATKYNIKNTADCQAALVDYIAMQGISGQAEKEGADTLEGSLQRMSASWSNFLTAAGDANADMDKYVDDLVNSAISAIGQISTKVTTIAPRLIDGLVSLINSISPQIPELIETLLPSILTGAVSIVSTLATQLPAIISSLYEALKSSLATVGEKIAEAFGITDLKGKVETFTSYCEEKFQPVLDKLKEVFDNVKEAAQPVIDKVTDFKTKAEEYVTSGDLMNDSLDALKTVIDNVATFATNMLDKLNSFITWCTENPETIKLIVSIVGALAVGIGSVVGAISLFNTVSGAVTTVITTLSTAWSALTAVISPTTLIIGAVIAAIILCITYWDEIKAVAISCWEAIQNAWNAAGEWFSTNIIEPIKTFFTGLWDSISSAASAALDAIEGIWLSVATWWNTNVIEPIKTHFTNLWDSIQNTFNGIKTYFEGLWDNIKSIFTELGVAIGDAVGGAVKNAINSVLTWIENTINKAIGLINSVIGVINKIPGVEIGTINEVSFNKLAKGGVLEKGQIGFLEGNGAEAVVPLENNRKWISSVANDMNNAGIGNNLSNEKLDRMIELLEDLPKTMQNAFESMRLNINQREFARMVRVVDLNA